MVYGDKTLIDLTQTTVTADTLLKGYTAIGKDGEKITGNLERGSADTSDLNATKDELLEGYTAIGKSGEKIQGNVLDVTKALKADDSMAGTLKRFFPIKDKALFGTLNTVFTNGLKDFRLEPNQGTPYGGAFFRDFSDLKIDPDEEAKLIPENIKKGVSILGVNGECEESIPDEYLNRYDLSHCAEGTFQPASDVSSYTVTNSSLNGATPRIVYFTMVNSEKFKPSSINGKYGVTHSIYFDGKLIKLSHGSAFGTHYGYTWMHSSGSVGRWNNDTDQARITTKANGFTIMTASGQSIYILSKYSYHYVCFW